MAQISLEEINSNQIHFPKLVVTSSPEETFALGKSIAPVLQKGSIVALTGPLGAGKTCLAKGLAKGLGVEEELASPTYTIISEYELFISKNAPSKSEKPARLFHIDAYRLAGDDDFSAIGGEEIVFGDGISMIEWSERIPAFIPPDSLMVEFRILEDEKRHIRIYWKSEAEKALPQ